MNEVTVQQWGAKGDGVTDDGLAFNSALAAACLKGCRVYVPWTPNGYRITTPIVLSGGSQYRWQRLVADRGTILHCPASLCLRIEGSFVDVEGFLFDMTGAPNDSQAVYIDDMVGHIREIQLNWLRFENCVCALRNAGSGLLDQLTVRNLTCQYLRGTQLNLPKSDGVITFEDIKLDGWGNTTAAPYCWPFARFGNFRGLTLNRFYVFGGMSAAPFNPTIAAVEFRGGVALRARDLFPDQCLGMHGILAANVDDLALDGTKCWVDGHALYLAGCTRVKATNTVIYGYKGQVPNPQSGAYGLLLADCRDAQLVNTTIQDFTGWPGVITNSQDVDLVNVRWKNCGAASLNGAPDKKNNVTIK